MNESELIVLLRDAVKENIAQFLVQQPTDEVVSVDWMEGLCRRVLPQLAEAAFEAWTDVLTAVAKELGLRCPKCGKARKCKTRPGKAMKILLLGLQVQVPKLYLECGNCDAKGVSITRLLTGLHSGDASMELKLMAGYCGAEHSYGKASRDLLAHRGQHVERTSVRRMALEVESWAKDFVEQERAEALKKVGAEAKTQGVERLMMQGDGGSVRTGTLVDCEPGDEGYGKTTPNTGKPRRKRVTQKREIITLDMRQPGNLDPGGLDVVVPCEAAPGQRSERMLALAARCGLGDDTKVLGLGDLGSSLPASFDEAFVTYDALYSGDWKHLCNYVDAAAAQLQGLDVDAARLQGIDVDEGIDVDAAAQLQGIDVDDWNRAMRDTIWNRDKDQRDDLLATAHNHRVSELPQDVRKCPVHALDSYICNNWHRMRSAQFKQMGVDYVSARAEAQVRERTRKRYEVPGAWRQENLEGKATLRAIIDEGSFGRFRKWCRKRSMDLFSCQLVVRIEGAVAQGRLGAEQANNLFNEPSTDQAVADAG